MADQFDPKTLHGIDFFDLATRSNMRYIHRDAGHWTAGWIIRITEGGQWETYRKATEADVKALNEAIVKAHHKMTRTK